MDARKKELTAQYRERKITGGVYAIRNVETGKVFLDAATDIRAAENRFGFSQKTGSCAYKRIQEDWNACGPGAFVFETLEEFEKGASQTEREFESDIAALKELWIEKTQAG